MSEILIELNLFKLYQPARGRLQRIIKTVKEKSGVSLTAFETESGFPPEIYLRGRFYVRSAECAIEQTIAPGTLESLADARTRDELADDIANVIIRRIEKMRIV